MCDFSYHSRCVCFNQVCIKSTFWQSRMQAAKEGALPVMWERMKESGRWDVLKLEWKEGMPNRPHHFWDSDVAKWTEAACYALTLPVDSLTRLGSNHSLPGQGTQDQTNNFLSTKVSEAVKLISEAQWKDGYINSYFTVVEPGKRWTNVAWYHEMYCAGHLLEAAIAHSIYTHSSTLETNNLLSPLLKYVTHIDQVFGPDVFKGQKPGYPGHQELELALLKLHDYLGENPHLVKLWPGDSEVGVEHAQKRVLSLANFFIHERGQKREGVHFYDYEAKLRNNDPPAKPGPAYQTAPRWTYNQADAPVSQVKTIEGHSVRAGYWLTAVTHLSRITKDEQLFLDALRLWENITEKKMHITGGVGAIGDWEGFGPEYYLPNESAYAETCASIALVLFAHQMLLIDPMDVRFGDVLERALYNGALVGMSLDGKTFFYDNPLATIGKWRERSNWFEVSCCPPNLVRLVTSLAKYIYTQSTHCDQENIHVHLFIESEAYLALRNGRGVRVVQETSAPWGGNVRIMIEGDGAHEVNVIIRVPDWGAKENVEITMTGYTRTLTLNDRILVFSPVAYHQQVYQITIKIPIKPRLIYPHPLDTENYAHVAVARGPFIYCVETIDNQAIGDLRQLRIPEGFSLEEITINFPGEAGDFVGLKGVASIAITQQTEIKDGWVLIGQDHMEANVLPDHNVTLVPYFAWANRGISDVRVWLPRAAPPYV